MAKSLGAMFNRDLYQRRRGKLRSFNKDLRSFLSFLRVYSKVRLYVIFDFFEKFPIWLKSKTLKFKVFNSTDSQK